MQGYDNTHKIRNFVFVWFRVYHHDEYSWIFFLCYFGVVYKVFFQISLSGKNINTLTCFMSYLWGTKGIKYLKIVQMNAICKQTSDRKYGS